MNDSGPISAVPAMIRNSNDQADVPVGAPLSPWDKDIPGIVSNIDPADVPSATTPLWAFEIGV